MDLVQLEAYIQQNKLPYGQSYVIGPSLRSTKSFTIIAPFSNLLFRASPMSSN
jgi:hypothetical protein